MTLSANDLWAFSLKVYPAWQQTLLALQDDYDLNINLILLCVYLEQQQQRLTAQQLTMLIQVCDQTKLLLTSLREVRRAAKGVDQQAYAQLKQAELELEKRQQQDLVEAVNGMQFVEQSEENILLYARQLQLPYSDKLQVLLHRLAD